MSDRKPSRFIIHKESSYTGNLSNSATLTTAHLPFSGSCLVWRPATIAFRPWLSWTLAAETPTTRGSPFASDRTCILEPGLPRSTGLGPVSSPLFSPYVGRVEDCAGEVSSSPHSSIRSSTASWSRPQTPALDQIMNRRCAADFDMPKHGGRTRQAHPPSTRRRDPRRRLDCRARWRRPEGPAERDAADRP